jgi:lauroyl/myristoyl acyltransferase
LILAIRQGYARRMFRLSTHMVSYVQSLPYLSFLTLVSLLPLALGYRVARAVGRVLCALDGARRKASAASLAARLGIDRAEAERITRRSFELMCCDDLEGWLVPRLGKESIGRLISFEGLDHLDAALARGKGAVLYSGHIWGSRLCIVGLALLGYRVVRVRRNRRYQGQGHERGWLRRHESGKGDAFQRRPFDRYRGFATNKARYRRTFETKLGGRSVGSVEPGRSVETGLMCVSALRKNEIVVLKPDLLFRKNTRPGDLDVNFLNGEETFRTGGALIARAAGAPLLSVWVHRPADLLPSRCVIGPPVEVHGDVRVAVEAQAAQMEAHAREDPASLCAWLCRVVPACGEAGFPGPELIPDRREALSS